ncbi:MAG: Gx transporter family protein [Pyramidobacter sp.]|jgi:heptaprenyl diphosphate synthase
MKTLNVLTRLALLTALSLILFVVEMALPAALPVPGAKLGLANVVTVWAVYFCTPVQAFLVLTARILLSALITGNAAALLFSFCGGMLSLAGGLLLKKAIPPARLWLTSALCGVLHNCGQIAAAAFATSTPALFSYLPFLVVSGIVCGALTGQIALQTQERLEHGFFNREDS